MPRNNPGPEVIPRSCSIGQNESHGPEVISRKTGKRKVEHDCTVSTFSVEQDFTKLETMVIIALSELFLELNELKWIILFNHVPSSN